jgi:hypothetical protein
MGPEALLNQDKDEQIEQSDYDISTLAGFDGRWK